MPDLGTVTGIGAAAGDAVRTPTRDLESETEPTAAPCFDSEPTKRQIEQGIHKTLEALDVPGQDVDIYDGNNLEAVIKTVAAGTSARKCDAVLARLSLSCKTSKAKADKVSAIIGAIARGRKFKRS